MNWTEKKDFSLPVSRPAGHFRSEQSAPPRDCLLARRTRRGPHRDLLSSDWDVLPMLIDFRSLRRSTRRPSTHVSTCEPLEVRMLLSVSPNLAPVLVDDSQAALVAAPSTAAEDPIATPLHDEGGMEGVTVTPTQII